jgi:hypothetical protein
VSIFQKQERQMLSNVEKKYLNEINNSGFLDSLKRNSKPPTLPPDTTVKKVPLNPHDSIILTQNLQNAIKISDKGIVYIQYADNGCNNSIQNIEGNLKQYGFNLATPQFLNEKMPNTTEVRYYYNDDTNAANDILNILKIINPEGNAKLSLKDPSTFPNQPPKGIFEIWVNSSFCK